MCDQRWNLGYDFRWSPWHRPRLTFLASAGRAIVVPVLHTASAPLSSGLRIALHVLMVFLTGLLMVRAAYGDARLGLLIVCLGVLFLGTYGVGSLLIAERTSASGWLARGWLAALSVEWVLLMVLTDDAVYLAFGLFFLYLHVLTGWRGPAAVVVSAAVAIVLWGLHDGFSAAAVIGPTIGAAVAIAFGVGYQALYREAEARQRLIDELRAAQQQLAATERERGVLDERSRLAADIHDTVAQGLSSIQMLLHAAERADPSGAGIEHVQLARQTASLNLAEARRLVRELSPAPLVGTTLDAALRRVGADIASVHGFDTEVVIDGDPVALPMAVETAILRITQGVLGNAAKHSHCDRCRITLSYLDGEVRLDVVDDGIGFDPDELDRHVRADDSFGFAVMSHRAEQLGGTLVIESAVGAGTAVSVAFEVER